MTTTRTDSERRWQAYQAERRALRAAGAPPAAIDALRARYGLPVRRASLQGAIQQLNDCLPCKAKAARARKRRAKGA